MAQLLKNPHPGFILQTEFLEPLNLSAYRLAKDIHISQTRISEIINERRGITADTSLRLGLYFGLNPRFFLGLQNDYDIKEVQRSNKKDFEKIKQHAHAA
ncbi:MAG: HigA family addiction module antidote protein [Bacteroidetes bacterium]|nr:HigA family addiction module antidote protein [Bacteroidota bacterium]